MDPVKQHDILEAFAEACETNDFSRISQTWSRFFHDLEAARGIFVVDDPRCEKALLPTDTLFGGKCALLGLLKGRCLALIQNTGSSRPFNYSVLLRQACVTGLQPGRESWRQIMAAKTTLKSNAVFTVALAPVQASLSAWRKERRHREPIPQPLWRSMVPLARAHGVGLVARVLRVNYTGLKNHVLSDSAPPPLGVVSQPGFIELPIGPGRVGPSTVIELEDRLGLKLTVRLVQGGNSEALALAGELWRHRA